MELATPGAFTEKWHHRLRRYRELERNCEGKGGQGDDSGIKTGCGTTRVGQSSCRCAVRVFRQASLGRQLIISGTREDKGETEKFA